LLEDSLGSSPPQGMFEPSAGDHLLGRAVRVFLPDGLNSRQYLVALEIARRVIQAQTTHHSLDLMSSPAAARWGFDAAVVQLPGRRAIGNGATPKTRLSESPFDVHPISLRTDHRFLGMDGVALGAESPDPRLGTPCEAKFSAAAFRHLGCGFGALGNQLALLLRERGIDMEGEFIAVATQLGHEEMHLVLHQPGDEVHIARQPIQPRDDQWSTRGSGFFQGGGQPGSKEQAVFARAGLNVLMPGFDMESFARSESLDVDPLCGEPQSAASLLTGADS